MDKTNMVVNNGFGSIIRLFPSSSLKTLLFMDMARMMPRSVAKQGRQPMLGRTRSPEPLKSYRGVRVSGTRL